MRSFHKIVIGIAVLVAIIIYIVMISDYSVRDKTHPPVLTDCPDGWKAKDYGVCYLPNPTVSKITDETDPTKQTLKIDNATNNLGNLVGHPIYKYSVGEKMEYSMIEKYYSLPEFRNVDGITFTSPSNPVVGYYTNDIPAGYNEKAPQNNWIDFNDNGWARNGTRMCEIGRWARMHNIMWDGVSNANVC